MLHSSCQAALSEMEFGVRDVRSLLENHGIQGVTICREVVFFFSPPQNRGRDRVSMVDCCQSSLPSQSWNLIRLTNRFGEFAAKACGARMWQNSLFTLNLTMKQLYTLLLQCSSGCAWCCSPGFFQRSNCLLVQFYLLSTIVNILKMTLSYIQFCNTGWSICQAKGTV